MSFFNGKFLVAKSKLQDPNFRQTVVLLVQHDDNGAFGLVVNRPVPVKELPCPVYAGGPCETEGLFLLHGHPEWTEPELAADNDDQPAKEVAPGIFLGDSSCAEKIENLKGDDPRVRMIAGYAGWGPGQLEGELAEGVWSLTAATGKLLFDVPAKQLWQHLKPPSIPEPSLN
jgi:putative transcriptional regulator